MHICHVHGVPTSMAHPRTTRNNWSGVQYHQISMNASKTLNLRTQSRRRWMESEYTSNEDISWHQQPEFHACRPCCCTSLLAQTQSWEICGFRNAFFEEKRGMFWHMFSSRPRNSIILPYLKHICVYTVKSEGQGIDESMLYTSHAGSIPLKTSDSDHRKCLHRLLHEQPSNKTTKNVILYMT